MLRFLGPPARSQEQIVHLSRVVESRELLNGGAPFGKVGQYERIRGYAVGELDPFDRQNAVIVNLDKAPRNASSGSSTAPT